MKNQNIVIAEMHCVKQVITMIRNVKKKDQKNNLQKQSFFFFLITVRGERDHHDKSSTLGVTLP